MSSRKGFSLFRKKKESNKDSGVRHLPEPPYLQIQDSRAQTVISVTPTSEVSRDSTEAENAAPREMSDERFPLCVRVMSRFQELLDESRRLKSDWIDSGNEEAETDLWPVLKKESNILQLTNQLHPNQNQYFFHPSFM